MPERAFPQDTTLVMAHPDDEALWASSVLPQADRILFCFENVTGKPAQTEGRRRSIAEYPGMNVSSLQLPESQVFGRAAWPEPIETDYGLAVQAAPGSQVEHYRENHGRLVATLRPFLSGCSAVVTHSPWGEYGHEEHVQVFRAVSHLQTELGFTLWVPGYVSNKSYALMTRYLWRLDRSLPPQLTDRDLGNKLKTLYQRNGCWTWFDDYVWPETEFFYRWTGPGEQMQDLRSGSIMGVNMLWIDWAPHRPPPLLNRLQRRLARLLGA